MNLPDLRPEQAQPIEILHETRWMKSLMHRAAAPEAAIPSIVSSRANWRTAIAVRPEQLAAADALVERRYAWRGYRVARSQEQALRVVLMAQNAGELKGTLTVRPDTSHGLFAELSYAHEIRAMRADGRRVGELVKLAVEEGADWRATLDALVQSAYLVTRMVHALDDVVIEVNPRHARFYQRVFGFVAAASERVCERVGAPSVLLRLDLDRFGQRLQLAA